MVLPPELSGKLVRCSACGVPFRAPKSPGAAGQSCPGCGAPLPQGAVICVDCGFDLAYGARRKTHMARSKDGKGFAARLATRLGYFFERVHRVPLILAALVIAADGLVPQFRPRWLYDFCPRGVRLRDLSQSGDAVAAEFFKIYADDIRGLWMVDEEGFPSKRDRTPRIPRPKPGHTHLMLYASGSLTAWEADMTEALGELARYRVEPAQRMDGEPSQVGEDSLVFGMSLRHAIVASTSPDEGLEKSIRSVLERLARLREEERDNSLHSGAWDKRHLLGQVLVGFVGGEGALMGEGPAMLDVLIQVMPAGRGYALLSVPATNVGHPYRPVAALILLNAPRGPYVLTEHGKPIQRFRAPLMRYTPWVTATSAVLFALLVIGSTVGATFFGKRVAERGATAATAIGSGVISVAFVALGLMFTLYSVAALRTLTGSPVSEFGEMGLTFLYWALAGVFLLAVHLAGAFSK